MARLARVLLLCSAACEVNELEFTQLSTSGANLNCSFVSECQKPLVCAWNRCHGTCETSRDCPLGQRCVQVRGSDGGLVLGRVCQFSDNVACTRNSDCQGDLICGIDGQCRNRCETARDCVDLQVCMAHTCADRGELNDGGGLDPVDGG